MARDRQRHKPLKTRAKRKFPEKAGNFLTHFKTGALNHSATLPSLEVSGLAKRAGPRKGQLSPIRHCGY
ncbi:hypothetical protein V1289_009500 [Bradyrhizobium sp. AZCC 2289]